MQLCNTSTYSWRFYIPLPLWLIFLSLRPCNVLKSLRRVKKLYLLRYVMKCDGSMKNLRTKTNIGRTMSTRSSNFFYPPLLLNTFRNLYICNKFMRKFCTLMSNKNKHPWTQGLNIIVKFIKLLISAIYNLHTYYIKWTQEQSFYM